MSDTPETDQYEHECLDSDLNGVMVVSVLVAQKIERERNELLTAIESLLDIGAAVVRDEDIIENKRRREIARELVRKIRK